MSLDLRWALHHPFRFIRAAWWHWAIAVLLLVKAVLITNPLWDVTATDHVWPIILGFTAAMCIASSIALSHHRLQVATAVTLFAVSATRGLTYLLLVVADSGPTTVVLGEAFAMHWALIAVYATKWPVVSTAARMDVTVQAGDDALGRLREAG